MSSPAKRYVNWDSVSFTPEGGAAVPITGVTSIDYDPAMKLLTLSGDNDAYNSTTVPESYDPSFKIKTNDLIAIHALPVGTIGAFTCRHLDARTGTTGAITYTAANAMVTAGSPAGAHRKYGEADLTITPISTDGRTNPVTIAVQGSGS